MNDDLQKRISEAMANPQNMGELPDADAVGTVGNAQCGDALRVWFKFKEEQGKKVIDRASFQSFGCETAIAAACLAMELIRGKTPEEALALSGPELAAKLGPLPPTKVHCTTLIESAIRAALAPEGTERKPVVSAPPVSTVHNLLDSLAQPAPNQSGLRVVFLDKEK